MNKDIQRKPDQPVDFSRVVRAAIHPGIGIARLGNSRADDGYFIGPETTGQSSGADLQPRDEAGALKRQAARFRIYGYDAQGHIVGELTADQAQIQWQVHLANRKAQWYKFDIAMDIAQAATLQVPLRNPHIDGAARADLVIDPGPRGISGKHSSGKDYQFDTGVFMGVNVPLGELRTDDNGRLLVLGGFANSGSPSSMPIYNPEEPYAFPNATEWFDDTSDGPVTATVEIAGKPIDVESAWVVVAQPDFAPGVIGWRTLYDLLIDTYTDCGWLRAPDTVSFSRDVLPVLQRLSGLQWVNKGFASLFGHGAPMDFSNPQLLAKLARNDESYSHLRRSVFNAFRAADNSVHEPRTWPWLYGDTFGGDDELAGNHLAPSLQRSELLRRWAQGKFVNDWDPAAKAVSVLAELPLSEQPAMLDQAALHFCTADAFHPGIELSWPMRHASMYRAPFRIKAMSACQQQPDFGPLLDQKTALSDNGPLHAQPPGGLSRWMALPWQIDTVGCRSGYDTEYDPYLPTFWPSQVPDQVLTEADYRTVMDTTQPRETRLAAFNRRARWGRQLSGGFIAQATQLVADVGVLGVLEMRPGMDNDPDIPDAMRVEIETTSSNTTRPMQYSVASANAPTPASVQQAALIEAGWESEAQYQEFCRILKR